MAQAASLWVKLGLSDSDFVKGLKQAETKLNQFGNRLGNIGDRMVRGFTLPVGLATGAMVKFGAELEQTKVAFEVMTGSADKAARMVSNFQAMAARTPFETRDLLQNAQTLMQYGVAADKTEETLQMLGDASAGNAEKLGLITYAFAQISATGRLTGQDLRQLVNAGFNPLQEISAKTGKSMTQLKQDMEDGKISFQMVEAAFKSATSEGGRFFGMMDKQSQTTAGKFSTFKDNAIIALTNIGTALLPLANKFMESLNPVIKTLQSIANWFTNLPAPIQNTIGSLLALSIAIGPVLKGVQFMTGGWSALIGILRMLPTLKIGAAIGDISTYLGGAMQGAWSLKTAMSALATSFTPFLVGGAIALGLVVLIDFFKRMAENARIAKLEIAQISEISDAEKKRQQIAADIERLQNQKKAASGQDTQGGWVSGGIGSFSAKDQADLDAYISQLREVEIVINRLKNPVKPIDTDTNLPNFADYFASMETGLEGTKTTIADVQGALAETLRFISEKEKLNLPGYDATAERLQALETAINAAIGATDANTEDGQMAIRLISNAYRSLYQQTDKSTSAIKSWTEAIDNSADAQKKAQRDAAINWTNEEENRNDTKKKEQRDAAQKWTEQFDNFFRPDALLSFNNAVLQSIPLLNQMMQGIAAGAEWGPMGMLVGAIGPLITESQAFKDLMAIINPLMQTFADSIGSVLRPFLPIASVISGTLIPIFTLLGAVLGNLFLPVIQFLFPVFKFLGVSVGMVAVAIGEFYNAIVTLINRAIGTHIKKIDTQGMKDDINDLWKLNWDDLINGTDKKLTDFTDQLTQGIRDAFNADTATDFLSKFKTNFNKIIRDALIENFISSQVLGPISDAINQAFNPTSAGGSNVTKTEFAALKALWDKVGEQGTGLFDIFKKLGIGVEGVTDATNAATQAMLNVPEGLKVQRYAYDAANAIQVTSPVIVPSSAIMTQTTPTPTTGGTTQGGGFGQTLIRIMLDGRDITDVVKVYLERDNVVFNGSTVPPTPTYAGT